VPFQNITVTKVTNFGDARKPIISPDGKFVVYQKGSATEGAGKFSIWLRPVGTTSEVQIVPATEGSLAEMSFSPDGKNISYSVRARPGNLSASAFIIPTFGGNATELPLKRAQHVSFSPDGKRLAYLDNRNFEGKTVLVVANSDGTAAHDITTRQAPNYYWAALKPSWSPDGNTIFCVGQNGNEGLNREQKSRSPRRNGPG
jgi:Tol biopolymer transport system component